MMEVLPGELAERLDLHPAFLQPGKATCVLAARSRRCLMNIQLMDARPAVVLMMHGIDMLSFSSHQICCTPTLEGALTVR